ncbi:hypothetical protein HQ81_0190 [Dickeya phage phiDP23.1]|uniref:Uncharacterized protein n=15 Tax=Aglimvirinae TaxID=2169530 RepID=I0J2P0_9CAUD|nr:hypothetical protein G379_gp189 [Dickeya phage vB-DsoM-LIMEstone1]AIM51341.1 hypothetical protein HQ80_0019 [Dickeya phage phiD3]AIM51490.1 hypothetical protein HQ82_0233 [Dickeya phage phiDP10.3]AIM51801.1 hypothetical protein HQ81_0190 [Dickeya phage phiDP23.1]ASD51201.1 hypothetical protein [Dickeya phage JA15]ASD51401.1 hypothetical protein [Dickeya phage XF4]ATW62020.1 hypothetical protein [Dickeya phage PP35]AYN55593.1 hypothetical protein [Dickeya phage Kamild]QHB41516.1 putative 
MFYLRSCAPIVFFIFLLDILIPRFIKEEVAFGLLGETEDPEIDEYYPMCALKDIEEGEDVAMIGTMRSFNLFGFALFPKLIGELRPYDPEATVEG